MKNLTKRLIYLLVKKANLIQIISRLKNEINLYNINNQLINNNGTFYQEANIINLQNDRTKISVDEGTHIRGELHIFKYGGKISIGKHCYIGDHTRIWSGEKIIIGNYVQISHNVNIIDTSSHEIEAFERAERYVDLIKNGPWEHKGNVKTAPIIIEDFAWISFNVSILKGVKIGKGAIVGACSVVTKDVKPFTLVAGNPAKFIKDINKS